MTDLFPHSFPQHTKVSSYNNNMHCQSSGRGLLFQFYLDQGHKDFLHVSMRQQLYGQPYLDYFLKTNNTCALSIIETNVS